MTWLDDRHWICHQIQGFFNWIGFDKKASVKSLTRSRLGEQIVIFWWNWSSLDNFLPWALGHEIAESHDQVRGRLNENKKKRPAASGLKSPRSFSTCTSSPKMVMQQVPNLIRTGQGLLNLLNFFQVKAMAKKEIPLSCYSNLILLNPSIRCNEGWIYQKHLPS